MKNMPPRNNLRSAGQGRAPREKQRSKETVTNPLSTSYFPEKIIKTQKTKRKTYTSATLVSKSKKPAIPKFKSKSKKNSEAAISMYRRSRTKSLPPASSHPPLLSTKTLTNARNGRSRSLGPPTPIPKRVGCSVKIKNKHPLKPIGILQLPKAPRTAIPKAPHHLKCPSTIPPPGAPQKRDDSIPPPPPPLTICGGEDFDFSSEEEGDSNDEDIELSR